MDMKVMTTGRQGTGCGIGYLAVWRFSVMTLALLAAFVILTGVAVAKPSVDGNAALGATELSEAQSDAMAGYFADKAETGAGGYMNASGYLAYAFTAGAQASSDEDSSLAGYFADIAAASATATLARRSAPAGYLAEVCAARTSGMQ